MSKETFDEFDFHADDSLVIEAIGEYKWLGYARPISGDLAVCGETARSALQKRLDAGLSS